MENGFSTRGDKGHRPSSASDSSSGGESSEPTKYSLCGSPESTSAIDVIVKQFKRKIYLIGIRALIEQGIPIYRGTEDIDIYCKITVRERNSPSSPSSSRGSSLELQNAGASLGWPL